MGCAGNWNRCLDLAKADFVCLLHADDLLVPEWHERFQESVRLCASPLDTAFYMGAARFDDDGGIVEAFSFADAPRLYPPGELLRRLWSRHFFGLTTSACTVYGRNVLARLGRFPGESFPNMADVPFHWNLLLDHPIVYDPSMLVLIRRGAPNQMGRGRRAELALGAFRAYEAVASRIAAVLGQSIARTTVEYLFPYGVQAVLGGRRRRNEIPESVVRGFREAMAQCPVSGILTFIVGELGERLRRWRLRRAWAKPVGAVRAAAEGKGCAGALAGRVGE
jgi:glycosyltransferase involved in cell wall biosynthesis